jgi:Holliday junction resolvase RusA-like endonuclease
VIQFTILGEPASKANSREIVTFGRGENKRAAVIKSEKARDYEADALRQIPPAARQQLQGPVRVTLRIFYATERPDLDESVVLDVLQDRWSKEKKDDAGRVIRPRTLVQRGVYANDRQVREKHVFHGIDKRNPRTEVLVEPLQAQQQGLDLPEPAFADQLDPAGVAF